MARMFRGSVSIAHIVRGSRDSKGFAAIGLLGILVALLAVAYFAMTQFGEQLSPTKSSSSTLPLPGTVSQEDLLKDPTLEMNRKAAEMKCTIDDTAENCTKK